MLATTFNFTDVGCTSLGSKHSTVTTAIPLPYTTAITATHCYTLPYTTATTAIPLLPLLHTAIPLLPLLHHCSHCHTTAHCWFKWLFLNASQRKPKKQKKLKWPFKGLL